MIVRSLRFDASIYHFDDAGKLVSVEPIPPPGAEILPPEAHEIARAVVDALRGQDLRPVQRDWLSAADVAEKLGHHVDTITAWCREGRLQGAVKVGRAWRVQAAALDSLMDEKTRDQQTRRQEQQRVDQALERQRARAAAQRARRRA